MVRREAGQAWKESPRRRPRRETTRGDRTPLIPYPFNEEQRLRALRGLGVLDTPPEDCLDRITRLARQCFDAPIALISLVGETRQWFKSADGVELAETARHVSFCGHAIMDDALLEVPDTARDPRFADNPLVAGEPHIRFYAGAPLVTETGFRLGTLCVIDQRPRAPLGEGQKAALRDLADMAARELYLAARDKAATDADANPGAAELDLAGQAQLFFIASLTHELRTPLNAIMGFSEAMSRELFGPMASERYLDYARHIHQSGRHLTELVDSVLDFARANSGEIRLEEDWVDVAETMVRCQAMFEEELRRAGVALRCHKSSDLPLLKADPVQIVQMLVNLIGNSIKFTEAGGTIEVTAVEGSDGDLILSVADTGIGIAPGDIEKALTPFGRIDNARTREQGGTGLGLALTQRLMALHGGELEIDSEVGAGTAVRLRFPRYRVATYCPAGELARTE